MTICVLLIPIGFAACATVVAQQPGNPAAGAITAPQTEDPLIPEDRLSEVISILEREYFRAVTRDELAAVARDRTLKSLDPYSTFLDPARLAEFDRDLHGTFGGVGVRLDDTAMGDGVRVIGPLWGSPALAAGVRAGDVIVAIDGWAAKGRMLDELRAKLQGPPGSSVTIETRRDPSAGTRTVAITRAVIATSSVLGVRRDAAGAWDYMIGTGGDAYVRITYFTETTVADFDAALTDLEKKRPTGFVLDLRDNSGGLASAAIAIADRFLDRGRIAMFKGRSESEAKDATPGARLTVPLALLVSPQTTAAAELVAAALQDNHRALVIGARTYGKGVVLKVFPLEADRGAVKLTVAQYERPSGVPIERHMPGSDPDSGGVSPDPAMTTAATEEQWAEWSNALLAHDQLVSLVPEESSESPRHDDPVLDQALKVLAADREKQRPRK